MQPQNTYGPHESIDRTFTVESTAFNTEGVVDVDMLNDLFGQIGDYMRRYQ